MRITDAHRESSDANRVGPGSRRTILHDIAPEEYTVHRAYIERPDPTQIHSEFNAQDSRDETSGPTDALCALHSDSRSKQFEVQTHYTLSAFVLMRVSCIRNGR